MTNTSPPEIDKEITVECPHCNSPVIIEKLNCAIFRHGIYIASGQQIHPHMAKEDCMKLIEENKIYGCGLPFRIVLHKENMYQAIKCDFI